MRSSSLNFGPKGLFVIPACLLIYLLVDLLGSSPVLSHTAGDERIVALSRRIEKSPGAAALYLRRAELFRARRDWAAALDDYRKAETLDRGLDLVDLCRGKLFLEMALPLRAKGAMDRFVRKQPKHAEGFFVRARVHERLGQHLRAAADYSSAAVLVPVSRTPPPELYVHRARALAAAGSDHIDQALEGLQEGISRLGPIVTLELCALELEAGAGRYDAALRRVDSALETARRPEAWLRRRGEILESAGRASEARLAYEKALRAMEEASELRRASRQDQRLCKELRAAMVRLESAARTKSLSVGGSR